MQFIKFSSKSAPCQKFSKKPGAVLAKTKFEVETTEHTVTLTSKLHSFDPVLSLNTLSSYLQ